MATLSIAIIKTRPKINGSYNIKIAIANNGKTVFMPTRFNIDNVEQFEAGKVKKREDAKEMNRKLRDLLSRCEDIVDGTCHYRMSAKELREQIENNLRNTGLLFDFANEYIDRLKSNNQTSYAQNVDYTLKYLMEKFGKTLTLEEINYKYLLDFEAFLRGRGQSDTTINMRMSHFKALLNAAVNEGRVNYIVFPFCNYRMPKKNVRDICLSKDEMLKLRDAVFDGFAAKRFTISRDLFMLSFYCAGINLTDLLDADVSGDILTFVRKKTANKKRTPDKSISITLQAEAKQIIAKYIGENGRLCIPHAFKCYEYFRSYVTDSLRMIGEMLGFEKRLMFYSARKTFVQFGSELGIPLYILEYAIGHTIKEANNRPVFNYLKVMRSQADLAIRVIIDYSFEPEEEGAMPLPEWARRRK